MYRKLKYRFVIIVQAFFTVLFSACDSGESQEHRTRDRVQQQHSIIGTWILQNSNSINYPKVIFKSDSSAIFSSRGDTIYRFRYFFDDAKIVLTNTFNNTKESYRILKLDKNHLIFGSLRENKKQQHYQRKLE